MRFDGISSDASKTYVQVLFEASDMLVDSSKVLTAFRTFFDAGFGYQEQTPDAFSGGPSSEGYVLTLEFPVVLSAPRVVTVLNPNQDALTGPFGSRLFSSSYRGPGPTEYPGMVIARDG